jgi:quinoprotein glucose dehydrogenase
VGESIPRPKTRACEASHAREAHHARPTLLLVVATQDPGNLDHKVVKPATKEAELALPRITPAQGLAVSLFAAEPMLANPVAFTVDERGRVFVAETYRIKKGVLDMRDHRSWLDDDLAARTVEQRVAQMKRHVKDWRSWSSGTTRSGLVEDRDGDGRADTSSVFADGFNDVASGIGAGVLARDGILYYTCIPDLWRLCEPPGGGAPRAPR